MWGGGGQGNHPLPPEGFNRSLNGSNGDSSSDADRVNAAAALAARMAFANAYDIAAPLSVVPNASSSYYDIYGGQSEQDDAAILYARRARELEFLHLQQQMQERQVIENAARSRLLEHDVLSRNQIQEFERTRIEMALLAEMQQLDGARYSRNNDSMNANALLSRADVDGDISQISQQQQSAEFVVSEQDQSLDHCSSDPQQCILPTKELSDTLESKSDLSPPKSNKSPVKNSTPRSQQTREPFPNKLNSSPPKKQIPKEEDLSNNKAPLPDNTESPNKKLASKGNAKVPAETPSLSLNENEKKITPVQAKSSVVSKKRKTPSKSSGTAASTGSKTKAAKKSPGGSSGGKPTPPPSELPLLLNRKAGTPCLDDNLPEITEAQYKNVEALMDVFCKVPFLSEFSRPVALLHPEVTLYAKIVEHPIDLGYVCRTIRRRGYKNTRAIQLDVWRVFNNCMKFHMHPSNKDNSIPSFISIAMHLREFFNSLWQEYMMPSDAPPRLPGKGISHVHSTFQKRAEWRKERLPTIASTILTPKFVSKVASAVEYFISSGGKVDNLDKDAVLGDISNASHDITTFVDSLRRAIKDMEIKVRNNEGYTVLDLHRDLKRCYTEDVFEHEILKKMKISQRLDRILGKALAPVHEINCRGVNQSSIWGCMAATVWARESKKKPYWPAIVLGILAPDDQKEDWHLLLTNRNENRLPEKLREDLKAAKRRAEQGLKKNEVMSYFLVEFMGSHEFIWVREGDIIESFDPDDDVNVASAGGNITKKKRSTAFNTKQMSDAIEEGRWALEEFELLLNDACSDGLDASEEYNESQTFDSLCLSDDEADDMNVDCKKAQRSEMDELNELLATDGLLDFSVEGRKKAKARAVALKRQSLLEFKKEKEREKAIRAKAKVSPKDDIKKDDLKKAEKLELEEKRLLEQRRIKRVRDHEKALKEIERRAKKTKGSDSEKKSSHCEIPNKRGRAETIAKGFIMRKCINDTSFNGISYQPTATVEPSGLLGMALAFRAAAGEVQVLHSSGNPVAVKSWEKIDVDGPMESTERCKKLQEKINLIEREILRVDTFTDRRLALIKKSEMALVNSQRRILDAEEQVRAAYAPKKKKSAAKKVDSVKAEALATQEEDEVFGDEFGGDDESYTNIVSAPA